MAVFKLRIKTDNAAFVDENGGSDEWARDTEIAAILRRLAAQFESGAPLSSRIADSNGNNVGNWEFDIA